jgi:NAD(P)-dependent dehydrogenase (short-subunit alcohol dehydrogenase family)
VSGTRLAGAACLITGAASGIGRATALGAARRGARLVLTDLRPEAVAAVSEEIQTAGGTVLETAAVDVTEHLAVRAFAEDVHEAHGSMDVVMNVAGVSTWGSVETLEHDDWRSMVEVNLMGPIAVIESFLPPMVRAGRGGHLVNVSSAAGLIGLPWHAAYSASKFGLRGVSEVLRFDLAQAGIGVSLVCPGAVDTPLVETMRIRGVDQSHPAMRKETARFKKHAVTPAQVAERILDGVNEGKYLVFTSRDIQIAFALSRWCPPLYELIMRRINARFTRLAGQARAA